MSHQPVKAIQTRYAGCHFRSRLEARWALFFDHLGIRWEYEPEGFETSAGRYLPDFRINMLVHASKLGYEYRQTAWFEVKPDNAVDDPKHRAFVDGSGDCLTVARGMSRDAWSQSQYLTMLSPGPDELVAPCPFGSGSYVRTNWDRVAFHSFQPGQVDLENGQSVSPLVDAALTAARSERFGR